MWRVTATYVEHNPDGSVWKRWTTTRHFQTEAAARHRRDVLMGAVEPANPDVSMLPRAKAVVIERSAPVDGWTEVPR